MRSYTFVPGAIAANTPTAMPADAPRFQRITSVTVLTEASGGTASTTSPTEATVVSAVPSGGLAANQFYFTNPSYGAGTGTWQYGSATTTGTVFILHGYAFGEQPRVA